MNIPFLLALSAYGAFLGAALGLPTAAAILAATIILILIHDLMPQQTRKEQDYE